MGAESSGLWRRFLLPFALFGTANHVLRRRSATYKPQSVSTLFSVSVWTRVQLFFTAAPVVVFLPSLFGDPATAKSLH
jgi:hypothetical protein